MRKIVISAAGILAVTMTMVLAAPAFAVAPHGGYGTGNAPNGVQTDFCLSCHDIHQAAGDYALMREATVTETCGTCHALFGVPTGAVPTWTQAPINLPDADTGEASVSPAAVYENVGSARVSGHRLGVSLDANSNPSDVIPGSSFTLKVMDSSTYEAGNLYGIDKPRDATSYTATKGLFCTSCHTPHGSVGGTDLEAGMPSGTPGLGVADKPLPVRNYTAGRVTSEEYYGDQLVVDDKTSSTPKNVLAEKLISSNPNHMLGRSLKSESFNDSDGDGAYDLAELYFDMDGDGHYTPGEPFIDTAKGPGDSIPPNGIWDDAEPFTDNLIVNGLRDSFMSVDEPPASYDQWCLGCHNAQGETQWGGIAGNNHPPLCTSCHSSTGGNKGIADFPHTSGNVKLLIQDSDGICIGCHASGTLP